MHDYTKLIKYMRESLEKTKSSIAYSVKCTGKSKKLNQLLDNQAGSMFINIAFSRKKTTVFEKQAGCSIEESFKLITGKIYVSDLKTIISLKPTYFIPLSVIEENIDKLEIRFNRYKTLTNMKIDVYKKGEIAVEND
jgi:hypothetical protein